MRVSTAAASDASRSKRASVLVSAAVASSDTSGIAPRATVVRIAASVSALTAGCAVARTMSHGHVVLDQPLRHARRLRVRVLGLQHAQHHHRHQAQPRQDAQVEVQRVERALHDLRVGAPAIAKLSLRCARCSAGTDRCRPWRRRSRESAGRYLASITGARAKNAARAASSSADLDVFVGGVRLRDVARTEHDRVDAALGEARRLGPEAEVDRVAPCARPAAARSPRGRAAAATDESWSPTRRSACGAVAARTRRSASASRSSARSSGAGRSENDSVARVGTTLNAMPPSSAGDVQVDALEPGRPLGAVFDAHVVQRDRRARQHRDRVQHLVDARRMPARRLQRDGGGA